MCFSEFAQFGPRDDHIDAHLKRISGQCRVSRISLNSFEVTIARQLLGAAEFDRTAWLIICEESTEEIVNKQSTLCFRDLIWNQAEPGYDISESVPSWLTNKRPNVVSIFLLRDLDAKFQPHENHEMDLFVFELSDKLIARTYLCLEYPGLVCDGGVFATFDLPAFARAAEHR